MQYGFSYNGIHCRDMLCTYVPSSTKRWTLPAYNVVSTDVTGRDGGYYYSTNLTNRTFTLDCFFEDQTEMQMRRIAQWLDRNSAGNLVFDDRPNVTYKVRPSKQFEPEIYEHLLEGKSARTYSGTFSATFTAYDPFGYVNINSYSDYDESSDYTSYCGMLHKDMMPNKPEPADTEFLLYNCGTESCGAYFVLEGSAPNGLTITNHTNGSVCKISALPDSPTLLIIDSENCRVGFAQGDVVDTTMLLSYGNYVLADSDDSVLILGVEKGSEFTIYDGTFVETFELHDEGYIELDSCGMVYRDIEVAWEAGSNLVTVLSKDIFVSNALIGKYIRINSEWRRIEDALNDGSLVLTGNFSESGNDLATIAGMNEQTISGDGLKLTNIFVKQTPKVL